MVCGNLANAMKGMEGRESGRKIRILFFFTLLGALHMLACFFLLPRSLVCALLVAS
jgi:hypothetical protein